MKKQVGWIVLAALVLAVQLSIPTSAQEAKITVMNPRGIQPPIRRIPMPERQSIEGKTVYVVDTKYANTKPFINELYGILKERYPETDWVLKEKRGMYMDDDPALWEEIKEKAAGMVIAIGH